MTPKTKPAEPVGFTNDQRGKTEDVVNDSLGTVDPADSTGSDEEKETGDAKRGNSNTRED